MYFKTLLVILYLLGLMLPVTSSARHRCPEPPGYQFSIFSSQFSVASSVASSIATGRTSNTSGCDRGHPSDGFYRPTGAIYLHNNLNWVMEESSKGQGKHLEALASLAGCQSSAFPVFSEVLRKNYETLFSQFTHLPQSEQADRIWYEVEEIITVDQQLRSVCSKAS